MWETKFGTLWQMSKARRALAEARRLDCTVGVGVAEDVVFRGAVQIGSKHAVVCVTWQLWKGVEGDFEPETADAPGTHKMRLSVCLSGDNGCFRTNVGPSSFAAKERRDLVRCVPALASRSAAAALAERLVDALQLCEETGELLLPP